MIKHQLIVSDPQILGAKPIIADTRITVEFVMDNLSAIKQIMDAPNEKLRTPLKAIGFNSLSQFNRACAVLMELNVSQ